MSAVGVAVMVLVTAGCGGGSAPPDRPAQRIHAREVIRARAAGAVRRAADPYLRGPWRIRVQCAPPARFKTTSSGSYTARCSAHLIARAPALMDLAGAPATKALASEPWLVTFDHDGLFRAAKMVATNDTIADESLAEFLARDSRHGCLDPSRSSLFVC